MSNFLIKRPARIALGAVVLLAVGYGFWWSGRMVQTTDDAYVESDISVLSPEVSGVVKTLYVKAHETVHQGQLLLDLKDDTFKAALSMAEANQAKAAAALEEAKALFSKAKTDLARVQHLATSNVSSRQSLDDALSQVDVTKARVDAASAALALASAEVKQAHIDLDHTKIVAPKDGVLSDPAVYEGGYVKAGAQAFMLVPQDFYVTANFKETQISHMKIGQKAQLSIDGLSEKKIEGQIVSLSPGTGSAFALLPPENATGNFTKIVQRVPVRIDLPHDANLIARLKTGLSVEVRVDTAQ